MRNVWEKIVAGLLTCSGFVTSLTIVLIVLFLFSEALGLFGSKVIEEGYVLALNKENVVDELSPKEIKDIFDEEITNWPKNNWARPTNMPALASPRWWSARRALSPLSPNNSSCNPTPSIW